MRTTALKANWASFCLLAAVGSWFVTVPETGAAEPPAQERHFLYVAAPGIRDYLQFGGAGILVFDIDRQHSFVRRIETPASQKSKPENIKGICANAATQRLYFSTPTLLYCLDLRTDKTLWERALPGGCDRMSLTPDGRRLFVPSFEGPHWNIVDGATGEVVAKIETKSGSHNTICSLDGAQAFLAGLRSPLLSVFDTKTQKLIRTVGPFSAAIRPFTVNASGTLCFVNVNDLLGFEIGDLTTGKRLHRVEVQQFHKGPVKRHGCPSHGIGLTPDEKEIWLCDGANSRVHVFDATVMPPRQMASIQLREQPGWITFSLDGRFAYPSTGEVVDTKTKKIVVALQDEKGRPVHSEKLLEIDFKEGVSMRSGDQFGLGRTADVTKPSTGAGSARKTSGHPSVASPPTEVLARADRLLEQNRRADARAAYTLAQEKIVDRYSAEARRALQGGVTCSLHLSDWDGALDRVSKFRRQEKAEPFRWRYRSSRETKEEKQARRSVAYFEQVRELLIQIAESLTANPQLVTPQRRQQLSAERIAVDFALVNHLLGLGFDTRHGWHQSLEWWWNAKDQAELEYGDSGWQYDYMGIPLGPDGQPRFIAAPLRYATDLGPGAKTLFLLNEVELLDTTATRDQGARALLKRALIARALYGPASDPGWDDAEFNYCFNKRPSFVSRYRGGPAKPFWELADDEARTLVNGRIQAIALPPSESPVALLRLLQRKYPHSAQVPEAIYLRGLYFQSRQQFAKALEEYHALRKAYPKHARSADAKKQIERIQHADVLLGRTHPYATGTMPTLWFAHRQTDQIDFQARPIDLVRYLRDRIKEAPEDSGITNFAWKFLWYPDGEGENDKAKELAKYLGQKATRWSEKVPRAEHVTTQVTLAPLTETGTYLVEARMPGRTQPSRALVTLTDLVIVHRRLAMKSLLYVADARTGQPVINQEVYCYRRNEHGKRMLKRKTNRNGVIEEAFGTGHDMNVLAISAQGGVAVAEFSPASWDPANKEHVDYAITDRPVYRPGATVQFRVWVRELVNHAYQPPAVNQPVQVAIDDPHNNRVKTFDLRSDRFGCVTGAFELGPEAALGEYSLAVQRKHESYDEPVGRFRVEMYKKPEFEVSVRPSAKQTRLGDKVRVRVEARYYFGGPVAGGLVRYQVLRKEREAAPAVPHPYDWLYGPGYGQYGYRYPWLLDGSKSSGGFEDANDWTYDSDDEDRGQVVKRAEARLNDDGTADIEMDTAALLQSARGADSQFLVQVEVRDASRRTVKGEGQLVVARQELAAAIELDRGWYPPNSEAVVEVAVRASTGTGVAVKGTLDLVRIGYESSSKDKPRLETVQTRDVQTDKQGRLSARLPLAQEGQYRVDFLTRDSSGQQVAARAFVWVHGPKFEGKAYRYADLEIIPDRREYRVGDTAHLLIHAAQPNAHILWSDDVRSYWLQDYRFLDIPAHAMVLDVRIEERHVPNFFVEGTLVSKGQIHTETCELIVPPVNDQLKVQITTDKPVYRPAENGVVRVAVTDAAGKPVSGQVTLTAYDKAVTYIQEETGPGPNLFIARRVTDRSSGSERGEDGARFDALGTFVCPEFEINDDGFSRFGGVAGSMPDGGDPAERGHESLATRGGPQRRSNADEPMERWVQPIVRKNFADTALWQAALELGRDGTIVTKLPLPQSLTTWRLHAYALTNRTQVGDATAEVLTTKHLLVRLQTPRFLVEGDEVILSANVQNALKTDKRVTTELIVPSSLFRTLGVGAGSPSIDETGNLHLRTPITVKANGTQRVDWLLRVLKAGPAPVIVKALTDEESDAMQLTVPILVHGSRVDVARSGSFRFEEESTQTVKLMLPEKLEPGQTHLEIKVSPGPIGVMIDALPMLIGYPYGCTEQTMSRFYPTIVTAQTLKKLGTDLEALGKLRNSTDKRNLTSRFPHSARSVFDSAEMRRMAQAGLERLYNFQHEDGGWGWWQHDASSPYLTAYVLLGLHTTEQAGFEVRPHVLERGYWYLLEVIHKTNQESGAPHTAEEWQTQAFLAYVVSLEDPRKAQPRTFPEVGSGDKVKHRQREHLFRQRDKLSPYGQALLALALHQAEEKQQAKLVLADLLRNLESDEKSATAWVRTPTEDWWHWWNSDIETNAWVLRALVQIDPRDDRAARLVQWLIAHRHQGSYWRSTRDTALVIAALADYLVAHKSAAVNCRVAVRVDGRAVKEITLAAENFLSLEHGLTLDEALLGPGRHEITLTKTGRGELYYACQLRYFTKSEVVQAEGKGLAITREYYRLSPDKNSRRAIGDGDPITVGDLIEVMLTIRAEDDYDYLAFEDPKPAGCEPAQLQSGSLWLGNHWVQAELMDDKVVLFVPYLAAGEHTLGYQVRAEVPGTFHVLPTRGFAMYAPEIRAISKENRLHLRD